MEKIKLFIKGVLIGIGKIIPGVSGSMIAISLGLYEKIMYAISNIFKNFKENSSFLVNIGFGIMFSIILVSKVIAFCLNDHYFPTMLLFIGLISGGIISIIKVIKEDVCKKNIILLILPFIFFWILDFITSTFNMNVNLTIISSLILGVLEAITMIIPGISGTAIMMMIGAYDDQLMMFSNFEYFPYLIMFIIGILFCTFIISKFITNVLEKYRNCCYCLIVGFSISSITVLLKQVFNHPFNSFDLFIGSVLLVLGIFISYKLE